MNDKRVLRICRKLNIKSTIKYTNHGCTRQAANPQYIAENILNREFTADAPNEKWLTDVTEFHYYIGIEKHKIYLSAILDLYDRRIVSYVIQDHNNNALVFDTVDKATEKLNKAISALVKKDAGQKVNGTNGTTGTSGKSGKTGSTSNTKSGKAAKTGDPSGMFAWLGLAVTSLGAGIGGFSLKRKKREDEE